MGVKSTRIEKQALACLMKKNTSVTGKWIAERTQMGHGCKESIAINRFGQGEKPGRHPRPQETPWSVD